MYHVLIVVCLVLKLNDFIQIYFCKWMTFRLTLFLHQDYDGMEPRWVPACFQLFHNTLLPILHESWYHLLLHLKKNWLYLITASRQLILIVWQIYSRAIVKLLEILCCGAGGSLNGGAVWSSWLVKVGGVDTEMYRTGHPRACTINLSTFCYRGCVAHAGKAEGCARPGAAMWSLERAFVPWSEPISLRRKRDVVAPSLTEVVFKRALKTSLIYHELFGCYVPSLWTLRTVRTDCSSFYQQLPGRKWARVKTFLWQMPFQVLKLVRVVNSEAGVCA